MYSFCEQEHYQYIMATIKDPTRYIIVIWHLNAMLYVSAFLIVDFVYVFHDLWA